MNLQRLPISRLQPAPYNPRIALKPGMPGYERLARSLREFDLVQPIVWNERTGHVVSGHQRLEVLRHEGTTDVDVAVVSLPLEREKALNVALNNPQVGGDWDTAKLTDLLAELEALPDFDVTLTGFDENDLRDLIFAPPPIEPDPPDPDPDEALVRMTVEVPPERWDALRPELDRLIAAWNLTVHVKLPN